jgi:cytochrome b subunit of formate dehydrogenase
MSPSGLPVDADKRCLHCHGQDRIATLDPAQRRSMVGTWLGTEQPAPGTAPATEPLKGDEPATRPNLRVHADALSAGPHKDLKCVECHTDAVKLPHAAVLNRATCATACHTKVAETYAASSHRKALDAGVHNAPTCVSCHGGHDIVRTADRKAPQNHLNALFLCGDCHKQHGKQADGADGAARVTSYLASAHAKAVTKSGLLGAATCVDCHTAHGVRPSKDPESTVSRANIPGTCGKCHAGVLETYSSSVHGKRLADKNTKAAVCSDCHTSHAISRATGSADFLRDVVDECGVCHNTPDSTGERLGTYYKTYHESYHGQITQLGGKRAARCSDCHGSHDIRPLKDPTSRVAPANLITTCARCHPGANASFVKFDPHANYRDSKNYPVLHGVWLYFMVLMSTVFTFFGLHTIFWFIRSTVARRKLGLHTHPAPVATQIRRFTALDRLNHALVALTFFGLTATGIPLVFARQAWAAPLATLFGGIEAAGLWHRFFAILLIINLILHFAVLGRRFFTRTCTWKEWIFGPNSLFPRWKDVVDCFGMFRWFLGLGKRPSFDRWTYWEKFDYWAEVGGSFIIGGSGLLLGFPVLTARLLPGWSFNVAMIVHGYEALLAIGFIFTIHFFNAHVRPGVFPVDEAIFTGSVPEHELEEQRPEEYKRLAATGGLAALRVPTPSARRRPINITIAIVSVGIGLALLALIVYGGLRPS